MTAVSYEDARALITELDTEYAERHSTCRLLREFWHGRYDGQSQKTLYDALFRDLVQDAQSKGTTTDYNLVRNLVFDVCVKYQSFLSGVPMIRTFVDKPGSRRSKAQAELKERVLYGTWSQVNMNQLLNRVAWYGPLMGDSFLGIMPNLEYNCIHAVVRSPEYAYPVLSYDGSKLDALLFCWETTEQKAKRAFPNYKGKKAGDNTSKVEVLEYNDDVQFRRWVDGELTNDVQHNYGFNLFDQIPFIPVPGEAFNHGAVEQSVNLVVAGSALHSLMMQAVIDNVFPRLVLEDPMKFSETLDTGPGAVIATNPGGKAYFLSPPQGPLAEGAQILQENERAIKQGTSMPDASFGQFDASIITGKAVNALQGAGTGSLVEMVQGSGIGVALSRFNEKALTIYQRAFRDDQVNLYGMQPASMIDLNPRQFALSFKGSEIVGSPRNEVVFSPYIDQHGKLVMGLQAQGAGLVSKQHTREQIGISDSEAMQEEITQEVIEEAVIGALMAELQRDPSEQNADATLSQASSYLSATAGPVRAPLSPQPPPGSPPVAAGPVPPGAGGPPQPGLEAGGGQLSSPPLPLPPGSPAPDVGAPPEAAPAQTPAAPASAGVTLQAAQQALSAVPIKGKAWLVGEIAATGQTSDVVDVAVTDPLDRDALGQAATFPVRFVVVDGEPQEQAVPIG